MGIDYILKSKSNPNLYQEDDPNQSLKWAIKDIEWKKILKLLRIDLSLLYDSPIHYWCPEQVNDMYLMIKNIDEDPYNLYIDWQKDELEDHMKEAIAKAKLLKEDIHKLKDYFEFLVKHDVYIEVL